MLSTYSKQARRKNTRNKSQEMEREMNGQKKEKSVTTRFSSVGKTRGRLDNNFYIWTRNY